MSTFAIPTMKPRMMQMIASSVLNLSPFLEDPSEEDHDYDDDEDGE
jgi:hypothetical protein